jgi:putative flippase GtrA
MDQKTRKLLFFEMIRYALVGGLAFVVDFGVMVLCREYLFALFVNIRLYLAVTAGFLAGLMVNYLLSISFVFRQVKNKEKAKSFGSFLVFALIGVIGLWLTNFLMYVTTDLLHIYYMVAKVIVSAIVMLWNYLGRKLFIFR